MTFLLYVLVSGAGGLLVGLIGTGSSLLLLPSLTLIFAGSMPENDPLRLAAGTTMATIAVGAIAGAVAQYRAGQVDTRLFRTMLPPYVLGASAGPLVSNLLPPKALAIYVSALVAIVALRMLLTKGADRHAGPSYVERPLEVRLVLFLIAFGSSIAGIASGIFAIPYLARFSLPMRTVMGTSTASAAVYATFGAIGYVSSGWSAESLPAHTVGYVYVPAFAVMALTALIATPQGVRLAGKVAEPVLRRGFAVFLLVAAAAILDL